MGSQEITSLTANTKQIRPPGSGACDLGDIAFSRQYLCQHPPTNPKLCHHLATTCSNTRATASARELTHRKLDKGSASTVAQAPNNSAICYTTPATVWSSSLICDSLYVSVCVQVSGSTCAHVCTYVSRPEDNFSASLEASPFLSSFLSPFLFSFFPSILSSSFFPPSSLLSFPPSCLSSCLLAFLPSFFPSFPYSFLSYF